MVVGTDSGKICILEYNAAKNSFDRVHIETFGKSGCRRIVSLLFKLVWRCKSLFMVAWYKFCIFKPPNGSINKSTEQIMLKNLFHFVLIWIKSITDLPFLNFSTILDTYMLKISLGKLNLGLCPVSIWPLTQREGPSWSAPWRSRSWSSSWTGRVLPNVKETAKSLFQLSFEIVLSIA